MARGSEMTDGQYEARAIETSHRLKFAIFYRSRIDDEKPIYDIFRRIPSGRVTKIMSTRSARTLARLFEREETGGVLRTGIRENPAARFSDEAAARRLSARFVGREPADEEFELVDFPDIPDSMANIGKVFAIEYLAERDGKEYRFRHEFKARSRPHLAVSPDGKIVTMIGGSWHFTEDGFEDL